jgi:hypothetical protein
VWRERGSGDASPPLQPEFLKNGVYNLIGNTGLSLNIVYHIYVIVSRKI